MASIASGSSSSAQGSFFKLSTRSVNGSRPSGSIRSGYKIYGPRSNPPRSRVGSRYLKSIESSAPSSSTPILPSILETSDPNLDGSDEEEEHPKAHTQALRDYQLARDRVCRVPKDHSRASTWHCRCSATSYFSGDRSFAPPRSSLWLSTSGFTAAVVYLESLGDVEILVIPYKLQISQLSDDKHHDASSESQKRNVISSSSFQQSAKPPLLPALSFANVKPNWSLKAPIAQMFQALGHSKIRDSLMSEDLLNGFLR
ncbi:hypothetical protein M9H77_28174 [Catharanthus roseus]|uniref:Uncharacterized protein n=1 Tax=Catharanthus roseus TaxID=4058 RepID=A0ACC0AF75_CATRO|nr:hypothetical protein M9H77_28174 [Catharanthus roseus]